MGVNSQGKNIDIQNMNSISDLMKTSTQHYKILKAAGESGEKQQIPTFVVGGFVRDILLTGKVKQDIDIMIEGDAIHFAHDLNEKCKLGTVVEYSRFNTALIKGGAIEVEIAGSRSESYESESRKPVVQDASVEEDLKRRDFTVNAMAASLWQQNFGQLFDPFGGIKDLQKRRLVTPMEPEKTFSDDPLRMLRACRFSAQLQFEISQSVLAAIKTQRERIKIISKERITEEIIKLLKTDKPSIGLNLLKEAGLLSFIFPELDIMSGVDVINGKGHKDVFIHTLQVVDNAAQLSDKMEIRFAALVHDIAKPNTKRFFEDKGWTFHGHEEIGRRMLRKIARRMKLSNDLRDYLMLLTKLHLRPIALAKKEITDSAVRRVMAETGDHIDDLMILCRADITSKNPKKVKKYMGNFVRVESLMQDVKMRDEMRAFQSPVRGDEIMKIFNLKPGREIGKIKSSIEGAILDGIIKNNYDAAYKYMMEIKDKILDTKEDTA